VTVNSPIAGQWSQTGMFGFGSEGNYSTPLRTRGVTIGGQVIDLLSSSEDTRERHLKDPFFPFNSLISSDLQQRVVTRTHVTPRGRLARGGM
jgi:hypothetical protein